MDSKELREMSRTGKRIKDCLSYAPLNDQWTTGTLAKPQGTYGADPRMIETTVF